MAAGLAACVAVGQTQILGTWKGRMEIDASRIKSQNAAQQKQVRDAVMTMAKGTSMVLTVKPNRTYVVMLTRTTAQGKRTQKVEGTWTFGSGKMILTPAKRDGKPVDPKRATKQEFSLAKDGKSLVRDLAGIAPGKLVYRR